MADRAQVTSVEALEIFRSHLIVYVEKLTNAADDVTDEVTRTRVWLENDRRLQLESELRRRAKVLEMAQQELFSSRISNLEPSTLDRQMAVRKAKNAVDETMHKLTVLKKWNRQFESEVDPLARQVEKMRTMLGTDMTEAVTSLTQMITILEAYVRLAAPDAGQAAATAASPDSENKEGDTPS
ncbi:MAG TPA: hypothetical protein VGH19_19250 [Verrucomicrobiae bacterium]